MDLIAYTSYATIPAAKLAHATKPLVLSLSRTGGFYNVICDYRNPDTGYNTIVVQDFWGPNGANALKIDLLSNFVYGSSFVVKAMLKR